jgi:hypothetical protein
MAGDVGRCRDGLEFQKSEIKNRLLDNRQSSGPRASWPRVIDE